MNKAPVDKTSKEDRVWAGLYLQTFLNINCSGINSEFGLKILSIFLRVNKKANRTKSYALVTLCDGKPPIVESTSIW